MRLLLQAASFFVKHAVLPSCGIRWRIHGTSLHIRGSAPCRVVRIPPRRHHKARHKARKAPQQIHRQCSSSGRPLRTPRHIVCQVQYNVPSSSRSPRAGIQSHNARMLMRMPGMRLYSSEIVHGSYLSFTCTGHNLHATWQDH